MYEREGEREGRFNCIPSLTVRGRILCVVFEGVVELVSQRWEMGERGGEGERERDGRRNLTFCHCQTCSFRRPELPLLVH